MYFASYAWYFNINYLPTFLKEQYGASRDLARAVPVVLSGWEHSRVSRRLAHRRVHTTDRRPKMGRRWFRVINTVVRRVIWFAFSLQVQ